MKRKIRLKKKFVVFLSLYAMFFVSYFTLTTLARYATSLNRNGTISVAKWDISIEGTDNEKLPTIFIGDSSTYQNYELTVTSKSEVAIEYSAIITDVPDGVKIQVDNGEIFESVNNIITIPKLGSFNAFREEDADSTHTRKHKLTILVPLGTAPFTEKKLNIELIFTQVEG